MKFIAKKQEDGNYELTGIDKATTPKGKKVDIVVGTVIVNKARLEEIITQFEEETEFFINQNVENMKKDREKQLEELKEELKAINKL